MNPDLYTKTVLTVIAACLLWLCVNGTTPTASAQTTQPPAPTRVLLVDEKNVPISTAQGLRVNFGGQSVPVSVSVTNPSLSVAVTNPSFAVALTAVERRGSWQPIDVRVMREPPTLQPTP
jgi:spore coat protein U-like protein